MNTIIKIFLSLFIFLNSGQISEYSENTYQEKTLEQSKEDGKWIYEDFCMRCHLPDGTGVSGMYPPLAKSNWLKNKIDVSISSIKYGLEGEVIVNGETYNNVMPKQGLSDEEVADVMNYIMNSWGNTQEKMITEQQVKNIADKN